MLEYLQCEFAVAPTGVRALEMLSSSTVFDLVLMDCQMPEMDGFEAARSIRRREAESGQHIPIIALTANAMIGDREQCLAAGMDEFLSKPFQLTELEQVLQRWFPSCRTSDGTNQLTVADYESSGPQAQRAE